MSLQIEHLNCVAREYGRGLLYQSVVNTTAEYITRDQYVAEEIDANLTIHNVIGERDSSLILIDLAFGPQLSTHFRATLGPMTDEIKFNYMEYDPLDRFKHDPHVEGPIHYQFYFRDDDRLRTWVTYHESKWTRADLASVLNEVSPHIFEAFGADIADREFYQKIITDWCFPR